MLRGAFKGVINTCIEFIDSLLAYVKPKSFELFSKFYGKRQTYVAETYDSDGGFFVLDFLEEHFGESLEG